MEIHDAAAAGYEAAAHDYEAGRPSYAAGAVQVLADLDAVGPDRLALDVGAGTGKWTRALRAAGSTVVAAEPVAAMRSVLRAVLPEALVVAGTAEALPVASARVDLVCAATALHWFDLERALAEMVRVTRPGGHLAVVRNDRDRSVDWVARLESILEPHRRHVPVASRTPWREVVRSHPLLTPITDARFDNPHEMDRAGLRRRIGSLSYIGAMPPGERAAVLAEVDALAATFTEPFTMPTTTQISVLRTATHPR